MCSRHAEPGAGHPIHVHSDGTADSDADCPAIGDIERPYRALVEEWDGGRVWVTVRAIGPKGAEGTAREVARLRGYDVASVLKVEAA